MTRQKTICIYEPTGNTRGIFSSLHSAWKELYDSRHVIWHLFKRDFLAQFRQKLLGYFWIILGPLLGILPFVFMHRSGILNPGAVEMPYPIYAFSGMGIWGLMISSFTAVSGGLLGNADLVVRTSIPKIALAITGLASVLYSLIVHMIVFVCLVLIFGVYPSLGALLYPLAILPIILFGVGLGLVFSVIGAVARDFTNIVVSGLGLFMYVSPVIYKIELNNSILKTFSLFNPLGYLVDVPRELFIHGIPTNLNGFLLSAAFSIFILITGIHSFYLIKDKVAERL